MCYTPFLVFASFKLVIASFPNQMCYTFLLPRPDGRPVIASFPNQMCYTNHSTYRAPPLVIASFPNQMCYTVRFPRICCVGVIASFPNQMCYTYIQFKPLNINGFFDFKIKNSEQKKLFITYFFLFFQASNQNFHRCILLFGYG